MASVEKRSKKKQKAFSRRTGSESHEGVLGNPARSAEESAASSHQHEQRPRTMQLEFAQAMEDFERMFPDMDRDVIESILRSNNGLVDATIDQLLTISKDQGDVDDNDDEGNSQDEYSDDDDDEAPPGYTVDPPSYSQVAAAPSRTHHHQQHVSASSLSSHQPRSSTYRRRWNPPLLGELPRDFLRISFPSPPSSSSPPSGSQQHHQHHQHHQPGPPSSMFSSQQHHQHHQPGPPSSMFSQHQHHHQPPAPSSLFLSSPSPSDVGTAAQGPKKSWWSRKSSKPVIEGDGRSYTQRQVSTIGNDVRRQIGENEKKILLLEKQKRGMAEDDELIALYLQNQEFLTMLRENDEFMTSLNREGGESTGANRSRTLSGGDGADDSLAAFPEGMPLPRDDDAVLRQQLKDMDQPSRRMFMKLANLFYSYKRKKSKNILGDEGGPATACLIDPDDEDEHKTSPDDDDSGEQTSDYEVRQRREGEVEGVSSFPWRQDKSNVL